MLSYMITFICLGLGTMTWRKSNWRLYGFLFLLAPMIIDSFCYGLMVLDPSLQLGLKSMNALFNMTHRVRHFCVGVLFVLAALWNAKDVYTDMELLQETINKSGNTYARFMALRLARAAIFGQSQLRSKFMDFYKQKEAEKDAVERSVEYQVRLFVFLAMESTCRLINLPCANRNSGKKPSQKIVLHPSLKKPIASLMRSCEWLSKKGLFLNLKTCLLRRMTSESHLGTPYVKLNIISL